MTVVQTMQVGLAIAIVVIVTCIVVAHRRSVASFHEHVRQSERMRKETRSGREGGKPV